MNPLRKLLPSVFIAYLFLFTIPLNAQIFNIESEMNTSVTAYITKRFNSYSPSKNLIYTMHIPPSQSEGLNTQTISNLRKTFTPYPTQINEFTDEYGNKGLELIWNKDIRVVQLDLQFSALIYSNFYTIESDAPYPVSVDDARKIFLTSTNLSPANNYLINYIGRSLSYDLNRQIDVVKNIFLWLDSTIHVTNTQHAEAQYDALSVLQFREGNEQGICNLAAALLKGLGIPVRVVYGVSFQKEMQFTLDGRNLFFDYPNGEHFWIEVFFPDLGWVSYDPQGMYFGSTSHVIKLSVGPDSEYAQDSWSSDNENIDFFQEYIYDIKQDNVKVNSIKKSGEVVNKLVLSSAVQGFTKYVKEPNLNLEGMNTSIEKEELLPGSAGIVTQNNNISQRLDIVATQNRIFAQKVDFEYPIRLTEVKLPLIKFGDEGKIWLEVYTDKNGIPDTLLFRSYYISSTRIRFMMVGDPWLSLPIGKKTDSRLEKGSYWFALRSSGSCIFNWVANAGNVVGDNEDTRFKDVKLKKPKWNNLVNVDMDYQIIGTRLKEKEGEAQ